MAPSVLDNSINYKETDLKIFPSDIDFDAMTYDDNIAGETRKFAIGNPQYTFNKKGIIYFPIYLIKNEMVDIRVGVYEIRMEQEASCFDEDQDVIIEKLGKPIYFMTIFKKLEQDATKEDTEKEAAIKEVEAREAAEVATAIEAVEIAKAAEAKKKFTSWIQQYLTDYDYGLKNNPGGGQCLFHVILDALEINKDKPEINKIVSLFKLTEAEVAEIKRIVQKKKQESKSEIDVRKLLGQLIRHVKLSKIRKLVASQATEEMFKHYKQTYNEYFGKKDELILVSQSILGDLTKKLEKNKEINEQIKKELEQSRDQAIQVKAREKAVKLNEENEDAIKKKAHEEKNLKELLMEDPELDYLKPLKNIHTLEQFREYLKSCKFWGESWAISMLEKTLNIKLILFSHNLYHSIKTGREKTKTLNDVIYCGDEIDEEIKKAGSFKPDAYIMFDHDGSHYQLITYKNQAIFTFAELPVQIKNLIKKCYENKGGNYKLIEDLKQYIIQEPSVKPAKEEKPAKGGRKTRRLNSDIRNIKHTRKFNSRV